MVPSAPPGIDPQLFARAKAALDLHQIAARDYIGIVDFTKASNEQRFHVVDLLYRPGAQLRVAHGLGSDPDHSGFVERFSNDFGSHATSNGTYTTADYYQGKYGLSMKVRGLDWSNSNAEPRAIVIHNAWYAEPEMIGIHGELGRSEGCSLLARRSMVGHAQACRRPHDLRRQARVSSIAGRPAYSLQFKTISAAAGADTPCHIAK